MCKARATSLASCWWATVKSTLRTTFVSLVCLHWVAFCVTVHSLSLGAGDAIVGTQTNAPPHAEDVEYKKLCTQDLEKKEIATWTDAVQRDFFVSATRDPPTCSRLTRAKTKHTQNFLFIALIIARTWQQFVCCSSNCSSMPSLSGATSARCKKTTSSCTQVCRKTYLCQLLTTDQKQ